MIIISIFGVISLIMILLNFGDSFFNGSISCGLKARCLINFILIHQYPEVYAIAFSRWLSLQVGDQNFFYQTFRFSI